MCLCCGVSTQHSQQYRKFEMYVVLLQGCHRGARASRGVLGAVGGQGAHPTVDALDQECGEPTG